MKPLQTSLLLAILSIFFFTSCLTSKKVDKEVALHYSEIPEAKKKKQEESITITSSITNMGTQISTTDTRTSKMLPLIVYWQWCYTNTCTINPQIPINNFISTVNSYSKKGLKEKLNGQSLELTIDEIPTKFQFLDKAHLIFLLYAYGWDYISIEAIDKEMTVSYRLLKDNQEMKKGVITINGYDHKKPLGMFTNWKTATSEYLTQFDENITAMSKQVVDKLMLEL